MARSSIFDIGLLVLAGLFLYSQGLITKPVPTSTAVTGACPRGSKYSRGLFGDCDLNYSMDFFGLGSNCICNTTTPATTPNVQPIPQPEPSTAHPSQVQPSARSCEQAGYPPPCVPPTATATPEQGGVPLTTLEPWNPAAPFYDFIGRP